MIMIITLIMAMIMIITLIMAMIMIITLIIAMIMIIILIMTMTMRIRTGILAAIDNVYNQSSRTKQKEKLKQALIWC